MRSQMSPLLPALLAVTGLAAAACGDNDAASPDAGAVDAQPPTPPEAAVSATELDFGSADCGGAAPSALTVTLTNGGERALSWSATLRFTPSFRVDGVNGGRLDGGASVELTVVADAVPAGAMAGQVLQDVLLITHDDPTRGPFELPVRLVARGATLAVTPASVDFGRIPLGAAAPAIPLTITNTGNAPAMVALQSPASGGLATSFDGGPDPVALAPGASLAGAQATFTPASLAAVDASATLAVTGAVCGARPGPIALKGQGIAAIALVSPATVDLGSTDCGQAAPGRTFVVANTGSQLMTWSAARDAGAASRLLLVPESGVLGPNSSQLVTVYAAPIPALADTTPGAFTETVTVTTDAAGDTPHEITIVQSARGAVLEFLEPELAMDAPLSLLAPGALPTGTAAIRNTGSGAATVTLSSENGAFALVGGEATIPPGATVDVPVRFVSPVGIGEVETAVNLATASATCAPLPTATARASVVATTDTEGPVVEVAINGRVRQNRSVTACARTRSGHVLCWGESVLGLRGRVPAPTSRTTPTFVTTNDGVLDDVVDLAAGRDWFCAERSDASQWCWGNLLSDGTFNRHNVNADSPPALLSRAAKVFDDLAGLAGSPTLACGINSDGATACVTTAGRSAALLSEVPATAEQLTLHAGGGFARLADGTVLSFGSNRVGERGADVATNAPASPVTSLTAVADVATGHGGFSRNSGHACARKLDGTVWCWGKGNQGRNGNGSESNATTPVQVKLDASTPLTGATTMSASREFGCAATSTNVFCWGRGDAAQLGLPAAGDQLFATPLSPALPGVATLHSADRFTCAILASGAVRCWGSAGWATWLTPTAVPAFEPTGEPPAP